MNTRLIFDAHLDLSLNALTYNRNLRLPNAEIRAAETGLCDLGGRGNSTVAFPEMRRAGIGLCVATQLAGCMKPAGAGGGWNSPEQAWAMSQGQLAWYRTMEDAGELRAISDTTALHTQLRQWQADPAQTPIGYILSLEGADSLRDLADLQRAYDYGLRALGPAHYGTGRYALGHDRDGPLTPQGRALLMEMQRLGIILDATHLCEQTFWDALECFEGPVWASHHNCRALVDDPRQLSDAQIRALAQRGAVIGIAFDIWMGVPNWQRGTSNHENYPNANLSALADHVDHVCQLLGTVQHTGIGTDLDGGYGTEQSPCDLDSIADLDKFIDILARRGYSGDDLDKICHGNFVQFLERAWG
ncbi:MAG: membrane dipeptidase [Pirellulaceae bacterium]